MSMFRCPKCHVELSADAKFCIRCGFNQTNARMMAVNEQGGSPQRGPGPGAPIQPVRSNTPPTPQGNGPQAQKANSLMSFAGPNGTPMADQGNPAQKGAPMMPRYPQQPGQPGQPGNGVPSTPPARIPMTPPGTMPPGAPPAQQWNQPGPPPGAIRASTPPANNYQPQQAIPQQASSPLATPRNELWDGLTLDDLYNDPAVRATSQAAEHWRESWRMRQKAEAGPAVGIARGQAVVPEPLRAMQHSIARMRAVMGSYNRPVADRSKGLAFWGPAILLVCLTIGLIVYSVSTFAGEKVATTKAAPTAQPEIMVTDTTTTTFTTNQIIHIAGGGFTPNATVNVSLDSNDTPGHAQGVESDKHGTIATTLTVPDTSMAGSYLLKATDSGTNAVAYLPVHVLPANIGASTSPLQETGGDALSFTTTTTHLSSKGQTITLKNPTNTPITWSAVSFSDYISTSKTRAPIAGDSENWFTINDAHAGGQLQAQGTDTLRVSANAAGLAPSTKAYTGYLIINTVDAQNQHSQMILKASLVLQPVGNEVIITPSTTLLLTRTPDGQCQPASITIANLGTATINYSVKPGDGNTPNFLAFDQTANGQVFPIGSIGYDAQGNILHTDVKAINISCHNIQAGDNLYHINLFAGSPQPILLNVSVLPG